MILRTTTVVEKSKELCGFRSIRNDAAVGILLCRVII